MRYHHLARFLADHFGGYESAQAAADQETGGNLDTYVSAFLNSMMGEGLDPEESVQFYEQVAAADRFLSEHSDFDELRAEHFEDTGNPRLSVDQLKRRDCDAGFKFLCELVWLWN